MHSLRTPGPKTLIPSAVLVKRTDREIAIKGDPIMTALVCTIGEDHMAPMVASGWTDVISAASEAALMLEVLDAAGLRAVRAYCEACKGTGGSGWIGDMHGGMPWTPCEECWPRSSDGELLALSPEWAEKLYPGFFKGPVE